MEGYCQERRYTPLIRCRHDTDNLDEVRASYRDVFTNKVKVSLCYTEFDDGKVKR